MRMTNQEAIKGLNNLFSEHELTLPCTDSLEILHMAVSSLEKQIPKKLIQSPDCEMCDKNGTVACDSKCGSYSAGGSILVCPRCGRTGYGLSEHHYDFCPKCGQAIDWRE